MGKSTTTSNDVLNAVLRAVDPTWRSNSSRWVALHTGTLNASSTAVTSECAYGSYARQEVVASSGFDAASGAASQNSALIQFPECTSGSETITYVSIVTTASGAGQILYFGPLNSSRSVSAGIQPQFSIGALDNKEA